MSDTVQFPIAHMNEKARTIQNQTSGLAEETSLHLQQMQQHQENLPTSMQAPFGDFIGGFQQRMSKGLNVRTQLSNILNDAANTSGNTDADIASGFKGFTD